MSARQKSDHRLRKFLRRIVEHPVPGAVDHYGLRIRKMPRQRAMHDGEAAGGAAAANEQRRRADRFRLRFRKRLALLVDLAEQRENIVP
jgi:hypothetical protein